MRRETLVSLLALLLLSTGPDRAAAESSLAVDEIPAVITSPSALGEVVFPHFLHIDDIGVECDECHHEIDAAALATPHDGFFDDFWIHCQTCHRGPSAVAAGAQACSNCHHQQPATIADQRLSAKVAIHRSCWGCHEVGTGVEASASCASCHQPRED